MMELLLAQRDAILIVHEASLGLVAQPDIFSVDALKNLVDLRMAQVAEIQRMDIEKEKIRSITDQVDEQEISRIKGEIHAYLQELTDSDERLGEMIEAKRVQVTKEMASAKKFINLPGNTQGEPLHSGRVFDVKR
ncbi:hypothetical protein ACFLZR_00905 [Candidatus Neomarinimicrobiota bacterium]